MKLNELKEKIQALLEKHSTKERELSHELNLIGTDSTFKVMLRIRVKEKHTFVFNEREIGSSPSRVLCSLGLKLLEFEASADPKLNKDTLEL